MASSERTVTARTNVFRIVFIVFLHLPRPSSVAIRIGARRPARDRV
jgi:hypothetical protein